MDPIILLAGLLEGNDSYDAIDLQEWLMRGGFAPTVPWDGGSLKVEYRGGKFRAVFRKDEFDWVANASSVEALIQEILS